MTYNETGRPDNRTAKKRFAGAETSIAAEVAGILAQVDRNAHDVAELGVPDPDHPARWGGLFSAAARAGIIRLVGYAPSSRPTVHRAIVRVWTGAEHGGAL